MHRSVAYVAGHGNEVLGDQHCYSRADVPGQAAAGLTAASLLTLAVVLALPVLALPAIVRGGVEPDLLAATLIGLAVFLALFAAGAL